LPLFEKPVTRILRNRINDLHIEVKNRVFYFNQETVLTPALLAQRRRGEPSHR
jgi:hypothetical protein